MEEHQTMQAPSILSPPVLPLSIFPVLPQCCLSTAPVLPSVLPHILSPILYQYCSPILLHTYCLSSAPVVPQNSPSTAPSTVSVLSQYCFNCLSTVSALPGHWFGSRVEGGMGSMCVVE